MKINDVVQFTENHKWCGCLGIISEDKGKAHPRRYMIGVPVPQQGTAYIFDDGSHIERIGEAVMVASMITISECHRLNTCYDCDNEKCIGHGKKEADCPKYHCDRDMDCEHCEFIDEFIENERKRWHKVKKTVGDAYTQREHPDLT